MPLGPTPIPPWFYTPAQSGVLAMSLPVVLWRDAITPTSQTVRIQLVQTPVTITVANVTFWVGTAGATLTANQNLISIYDNAASANKLGTSADQSGNWTSTGLKTVAVSASVTTNAVYVAILSNGTTPVSPRGMSTGPGSSNFNLSAAASTFADNASGQTSMPANLTLSSNTQAGGCYGYALT